LGTAYRLKNAGVQDVWSALKEALVPEPFKTNVELEAVCAALARTGLVLPASAWGGMVYVFNDGVVQLGALADLENARCDPGLESFCSYCARLLNRGVC